MHFAAMLIVIGCTALITKPQAPPAELVALESGPKLGEKVPHLKVRSTGGQRLCFQCALT